MSPFHKALRKLEKTWAKKLRNSGFKDIENVSEGGRTLKEWDTNFFRNNFSKVNYETTVSYYDEAARLLDEYKFKNKTHRKIWELHASGMSVRKIAEKIKGQRRSMIHLIITEIASNIRGMQ